MMLVIKDTRLAVRTKVGDILDIQTTTVNGKFIIVPAHGDYCLKCVLHEACNKGTKGFLCPNDAQPEVLEDLI